MNIEKRLEIMMAGSGDCVLMGDCVIGYIFVDHGKDEEARRELNRMLNEVYEYAADNSDDTFREFFRVLAAYVETDFETEEWNRVMANKRAQEET